ncbi:hypothetical protein [Pseudoxanthomonas sp. USHLN014]
MTLAQLRAFTAAAARDDRHREARSAIAARVAMGADKNDWTNYLRTLD